MRREQYLGMTDYLDNNPMDDVSMEDTDLSGFMSRSIGEMSPDMPPKVVTRTRPVAVPPISPPQEMGYVALSDEEGTWSPINPFYAHDDALGHPYLSVGPKVLGGLGLIYFGSRIAVAKKVGIDNPSLKTGAAVSLGMYLHPTIGWNHGVGQNLVDKDVWWWTATKLAVHTGGAYMFFIRPLRG